MPRVPFAEAITEPLLLKDRWAKLSIGQRVALRAYYGLPLVGDEEREVWAASQGGASYDALGRILEVKDVPYAPQEYRQLWLVAGRRSGKTSHVAATIFAYECTLGGHEEYIEEGQEFLALLIAQSMGIAKKHLSFVRNALNSSKILAKEIVSDIGEGIRLRNGMLITPSACNIKAARGLAVPVAYLDEVGVWYQDAESANPDVEVERAVAPCQVQFPNYRRFATSTPYTKEGLLYGYWKAGTKGKNLVSESAIPFRNVLVCHLPTAAMKNPRVPEGELEEELARDPENYRREYKAEFVSAMASYFEEKALDRCVTKGMIERQPMPRADHPEDPKPSYVAAMDPAFRYDAFGFCIVHLEPSKGVVLDVVRRWIPTKGERVKPGAVLDEISTLMRAYKIEAVLSDQYQLESLQQLALERGFTVCGVDFTGKSKSQIVGSLHTLVQQGRLQLLDPDQNTTMRILLQELLGLEKHLTAGGNVQVAASTGKHDDLAMVLALAASQAIWCPPASEAKDPEIPPMRTLAQRIDDRVYGRMRQQDEGWDL